MTQMGESNYLLEIGSCSAVSQKKMFMVTDKSEYMQHGTTEIIEPSHCKSTSHWERQDYSTG